MLGEALRLSYLDTTEAEWLYEHFPKLGHSPDESCPTCDKKGSYFWKGVQHTCDCELQLQLLKHYLAAGIGVPYQRLDWNDLDSDDLVAQIEKYVTNPEYLRRGIGLFLVGSYGTGKTMVATLCLKDFIKSGHNCFATSFAEMIDSYAAGWYSDSDRKRFQRKVVESEVLLIDDVGKEHKRTNDLVLSTFDLVLRERVKHGRSTIITSNMTAQGIGGDYGWPILSLLREKSLVIEVDGPDFRRKAHQREMAEIAAGETRPIQ